MERTIYNPVQKDTVTFLRTSAETQGTSTLVKVELADGGGVGLHYHKRFSEQFTALTGEVQVQLGDALHTLKPGASAVAEPNVDHLFRNRSGAHCTFEVELRPASRGFEESLQIGYGLARDGQCRANGLPKDPLILALLFVKTESNLRGWRSAFEFILRWQATRAVKNGLEKRLVERYVRF